MQKCIHILFEKKWELYWICMNGDIHHLPNEYIHGLVTNWLIIQLNNTSHHSDSFLNSCNL